MKKILVIIAIVFSLLVTSCVQKTYKKTVVFTLDVSEIKNVKKVGIRGNEKPLSWDYDTEMKEIKKDSLYQITITSETGYKFTEVKFVVNDTFELQNEDNRRVLFSEKDTTFFKAKFNKR
ncbi:hypothetical protein [Flavobacterium ammonificans]|uniref:Oxidoreductase n=1 Tax=Flavobacterium ammonificans TaxID=1751056 RepID=A0ABN6KSF3_9FLAO|nr:hypothetical protein [Flavobacterium ammonificans]BDB52062.1 hypothetical protein GENT11_03740 [Flavobacterium ammonificans]